MLDQEQIARLKELLAAVKSVLVMLKSQPSLDQVATAIALAKSLTQAGKEVILASPEELSGEALDLLGADLVKQKLGNQDLTISFPYEETAVDKVSYHISDDNSSFYLIIKPHKGHKPLDANRVQLDYTGAAAEMVFLVGVHEFDQLEHLYDSYKQLYESATIVTLHTFEPEIGGIKLDLSGKSCLSEAVFGLLGQLELTLDADSATNLLLVIERATEDFRSLATTAETFEMVGALMRLGARRLRRSQPPPEAILTEEKPRHAVVEVVPESVATITSHPAPAFSDNTTFGQALQRKKPTQLGWAFADDHEQSAGQKLLGRRLAANFSRPETIHHQSKTQCQMAQRERPDCRRCNLYH